MADEEPDVPVMCPECNTETTVPLSDVESTLADHNEEHHGGDTVATVTPEIKEHIADLVAEDLDLLD